MDLTDFVKTVLTSLDKGVDAARAETSRDIHFTYGKDTRVVEFDIAVSAESKKSASGTAGVRVLEFVKAGGDVQGEKINSTVSRVKFGIDISSLTKTEQAAEEAAAAEHNQNLAWQDISQG